MARCKVVGAHVVLLLIAALTFRWSDANNMRQISQPFASSLNEMYPDQCDRSGGDEIDGCEVVPAVNWDQVAFVCQHTKFGFGFDSKHYHFFFGYQGKRVDSCSCLISDNMTGCFGYFSAERWYNTGIYPNVQCYVRNEISVNVVRKFYDTMPNCEDSLD